ncbi:hypothetical protein [Symbiopectobacterium sp. RP]|uniref:hypothetical protein n=1 Tax=Symbiopectobacterium sp. RP TaxID=3248553 RepID=UPI003D2D19FE
MSINGHKQKKREWLRYRDFVLSPYAVIKIKSLGYIACHNREVLAFLLLSDCGRRGGSKLILRLRQITR